MDRLRPDDHYMILTETDASPMHIGALQFVRGTGGSTVGVCRQMAAHLHRALALHTAATLAFGQAPFGYDSDIWLESARFDPAVHILRQPPGRPLSESDLLDSTRPLSVERINLRHPPFAFTCLTISPMGAARCSSRCIMRWPMASIPVDPRTVRDKAAIPPSPCAKRPERPPHAPLCCCALGCASAANGPLRAQAKQRRVAALAAIKGLQADPATRRPKTPTLNLSGPTSSHRCYATLSLSLPAIKAAGIALDATINDIFLAIAATAIRGYLIEIDDLPSGPIVATGARSYRKPEHGPFGNRIVALNPSLATDIADPLERLRAIQHSMARERLRTAYDEAMLDHPETPFGPRDRRRKYANVTGRARRFHPAMSRCRTSRDLRNDGDRRLPPIV